MTVLASDPGGAQICAFFSGIMLLLGLVCSLIYAAGQDEWALKHWTPAIMTLTVLVAVIAFLLVNLD